MRVNIQNTRSHEFHLFQGPVTIKVDENATADETPEPCYFMNSPEIQSNLSKKLALGEKCLMMKSPKFVFGYGARAISIDDIKCGTKDSSTVEQIKTSGLCFSQTDNKLSKKTPR